MIRTKEIINHPFRGFLINLPAGLKVVQIAGCYFLDEFPNFPDGINHEKYTSFVPNTFLYHDAIHYGIIFDENEIIKE